MVYVRIIIVFTSDIIIKVGVAAAIIRIEDIAKSEKFTELVMMGL